MKNKLYFAAAFVVILICILSPFIVSDMQNFRMLQEEYLVQSETSEEQSVQNLLKKIQIYNEGIVIESRALSTYEMYNDYAYTENGEIVELMSGFAFVWQKVREELTKMAEMEILPKEMLDRMSNPNDAEWILQTYVSKDITYEMITVWEIWYEKSGTWINVVMETGSYKIIQAYCSGEGETDESSQIGNEQAAKQLGIYFGTQEMIITAGRNVLYRLDDVEVMYQVEETGFTCM